MLVWIGFEVVSRGEQAQEAVVTVFARETLHSAQYQGEEVEGAGVGHHATQVKEEPNLERASNLGTARY